MIKFSKGEIFITFDKRSDHYWTDVSSEAISSFGEGPFSTPDEVRKVLIFCYNWCIDRFVSIIHEQNDLNFVKYLFANHESSIRLWKRVLAGENIFETSGILENDIALNRRILKLALEQTCDIDYTTAEELDQEVIKFYVSLVEDLLYLGSQIYAIAEHLAEQRMMEDPLEVLCNEQLLLEVRRKHHYDHIIEYVNDEFQLGFQKGIVSDTLVVELREKIKECFGFEYDFAGGQIFHIKKELNSNSPNFQTIQPSVLRENLVAAGIPQDIADLFYDGLTISRSNKLSIENSVYQSHSLKRHMFRPILILRIKGEDRALVGLEKWSESIVVMATNAFQWQLAPEEWLVNKCFKAFIQGKTDEHDKLLEKEIEEVILEVGLPFVRNVLSFTNKVKQVKRIDTAGVGEIDFLFIDRASSKVIVADSKYLRSKYEMVGWSRDFTNFDREYRPKIEAKVAWIGANKQHVKEHFDSLFGDVGDISDFEVQPLFVVNTPTFYMMNGKIKTITITRLKDFINNGYEFPILAIETDRKLKEISHPYFRVQ